jgi:hypothetical protein
MVEVDQKRRLEDVGGEEGGSVDRFEGYQDGGGVGVGVKKG